MKSPVNRNVSLEIVDLEDGLKAYRCPESGGHWIPPEIYWQWQRQLPGSAKTRLVSEDEDAKVKPPESAFDDRVKLCPETGTIMSRFRVGQRLDFRVDRSINGGVWLDGGEWEALRAGNLHQNLHKVFTAPWQRAIRKAEHAERRERLLRERMGDDLYSRLASLREDLANHPARPEALAFLSCAIENKRDGS